MYQELRDNSVNVAIYYPKSLHVQKCFEYLGYKKKDLPVTERVSDTIINLPCYAELKEEELEYVCKTFSKIVQNKQ